MPIRLFEVNDAYFLFNGDNCCLIRVPNDSVDSIVLDEENAVPDELLSEKLRNIGFYKSKTSDSPVLSPKRITLNLVQSCNLACSYCYASAGTYKNRGVMTIETARASVDWLIRNSDSKKLHITFFGGEPLLGLSVLKSVVAYCHELEENDNELRFGFAITTNGTLLDKETASYLQEEKVKVTVSIDGGKSKHDANRYYPDGKGSFDSIKNNLLNFDPHSMPAGKATVSRANANLTNDFLSIKELGFRSIPITLAFDSLTDDEFPILSEETSKFVGYLRSSVEKKEYRDVRLASRTYSILRRIHYGLARDYLCGAGSSLRCVDVDGNIYPCHRLVAHGQQYVMGSVYDSGTAKGSTIAKAPSYCDGCWARALCVGGCPVNRIAVKGTPEIPDQRYCLYQKKYLSELIEFYIQLSPEDKLALFDSKSKD